MCVQGHPYIRGSNQANRSSWSQVKPWFKPQLDPMTIPALHHTPPRSPQHAQHAQHEWGSQRGSPVKNSTLGGAPQQLQGGAAYTPGPLSPPHQRSGEPSNVGTSTQQQRGLSADGAKQAGATASVQQPEQQGRARQEADQSLRSFAESAGISEQLSSVRSPLQRLSSNRGLERAPSVHSSTASLPEQATGATGQVQQLPAVQKKSAQPVESDSETGSESGSDIESESGSEAEAQLMQQKGKPGLSAAFAVRSNRSSQSLDKQSEAMRSIRSTEDVAQTKSAALQQQVKKQQLSGEDGPALQVASSTQQPAQPQKKRWNVFAKSSG